MVTTTNLLKTFLMTYTSDKNSAAKPCLWGAEYVIENLPPWIYNDNEPPTSSQECRAKVSALEYTIKDIELQVEIRELELHTGNSRHQSSFDYEKWKVQALRAKQTHFYLLNAYKYWLIKNTPEQVDTDQKLCKLIELLIEDSDDFELHASRLLK
jgi:hypothetical protein